MNHNTHQKLPLLILLIASLLLGFTACSQKPVSKPPIKISIDVWAGYAHAFIAQEKGFFKKNGVEVQLVFEKNYTTSTGHYVNGDVDGVFEVFTDAILQRASGNYGKVVYVVDRSTSGDVIIGRPEIKDLTELKLKKVGVEGVNTFSHLFVMTALEKAGLKETELRFDVVPAHDVLEALQSGKIAAGHTYEPTKSKALQAGYKILATAGDTPGIITDVLVLNDRILQERPEEVRAILKSLFEALNFETFHREEALSIMSKAVGMDKAEMASGLHGAKALDLIENKRAMRRDSGVESLASVGEVIANFYLERGQLSSLPDMDQVIDARFVEALENK
ncbi:MAG: ABC transporter substrate-binding protein [Deltaproteobacteria bacterium]|nr:ABC transporter substrate-binding protein [Deltaproteobacteria bacterium]